MSRMATEPLNTDEMVLAVIGLGYIGLPTAIAFAEAGVRVIGVDTQPERVASVARGELPFVEDKLQEHLTRAVSSGKLTAQTKAPQADAFIISVPTPFADDHGLDPYFIDSAVDEIIPMLTGSELVILESTSPVGTTEYVVDRIRQARPELTDLEFAHAPERVTPGSIVKELTHNDRIIGGLTEHAAEKTGALYKNFCEGNVYLTDVRTAEMCKLTENSFRDVNIAFANELSLICDRLGIDVWELIELANKHPRVSILKPGPGVGGHCIAVDPWFIVSKTPDLANIVRTAREVNDSKPEWVLGKVEAAIDGNDAPVITTLGLAFKANVDDLRESPSVQITKNIKARYPHAHVIAVEPNLTHSPAQLDGTDIEFSTDGLDAVKRADVVVLLVAHDPFKAITKEDLKGKHVVDTQGMWR